MQYFNLTLKTNILIFALGFFPLDVPFSYFAEVFTAVNGREVLVYHGKHYMKHTKSAKKVHWRCPLHSTGCRARIVSCMVDGYLMVNKSDANIIHTDHNGKPMKLYELQNS